MRLSHSEVVRMGIACVGVAHKLKMVWGIYHFCTISGDIKPDELVDFLEDVLGDVFEDLHIEDDSIQMVGCKTLWEMSLYGLGFCIIKCNLLPCTSMALWDLYLNP